MDKATPIDEEFIFEGSSIISQTDSKGIITYVNRMFCEVSGYSVVELIGKKHSIIKHPMMPSLIFEKMWTTVSSGHTWSGLMKNMRKDGLFYWIDMEVLPILDENEAPSGYIASGRVPSRKNIKENDAAYKEIYVKSRYLHVNI